MKHHFQFWKVGGAVGNSTTNLRGVVCSRFSGRGGTGTEKGNLSPPAVSESDLGGGGAHVFHRRLVLRRVRAAGRAGRVRRQSVSSGRHRREDENADRRHVPTM